MAILQNRLSTELVSDAYLDPDVRNRATLNEDWESGPIAVTDMSEGSKYQAWRLTFSSGDFIITPELTGSPVVVLSGQDSVQCSLAFDQNGRPNIAWVNSSGTGFLYWYDTLTADFVITNHGACGGIAVYLDDKRLMQSSVSDVLFFYTKSESSEWVLYHRRQRDRFLTEFEMIRPTAQYIFKAGMHRSLRGQFEMTDLVLVPEEPPVPPGPSIPQANLDFELGDVYWSKTGDFSIVEADPFMGSWAAMLMTTVMEYSTMENQVFTIVIPGAPVFISCVVKGTLATNVKIGLKFFNIAFAELSVDSATKGVTTSWAQIVHGTTAPPTAVYASIFVESDSTDGTVRFDNFNFAPVASTNELYEVELGALVIYEVELDALENYEIEI